MKKSVVALVVVTLVALFLAVPADAERIAPNRNGDVEPACEASTALHVPAGTETWYEGDMLRFRVPEGHTVWTRTASGLYAELEGGGVECSCSTGDCSPIERDGTIYCLVGPGCTTSCSREETEVAVMVADMRAGVRFADHQDFARLPFARPEMLDIPYVRKAAESFVQRAFENHPPVGLNVVGNHAKAPEGYVLQPINLFGHLAHALVPAEAASTDLVAEDGSCSCNAGSEGCEYWSRGWPVNISGCDAGSCTACEMQTE